MLSAEKEVKKDILLQQIYEKYNHDKSEVEVLYLEEWIMLDDDSLAEVLDDELQKQPIRLRLAPERLIYSFFIVFKIETPCDITQTTSIWHVYVHCYYEMSLSQTKEYGC